MNYRVNRAKTNNLALHMRSQQSIIRSNRICGHFFVFLALLSLAVSCFHLFFGRWGLVLLGVPGVLFFGLIGWLVLTGTTRIFPDAGNSGISDDGKPAPVNPSPIHHLAAAKELPPSDKTRSLPKD